MEAGENTLDMVMMNVLRLRVYEDVIQVDHHKNIGHILEDVIHKVLKCGWHIGKSHWHDKKFKGAISGPKHCFPFVTRGNVDIVVSGTLSRIVIASILHFKVHTTYCIRLSTSTSAYVIPHPI